MDTRSPAAVWDNTHFAHLKSRSIDDRNVRDLLVNYGGPRAIATQAAALVFGQVTAPTPRAREGFLPAMLGTYKRTFTKEIVGPKAVVGAGFPQKGPPPHPRDDGPIDKGLSYLRSSASRSLTVVVPRARRAGHR
jgi:hypothetical protein